MKTPVYSLVLYLLRAPALHLVVEEKWSLPAMNLLMDDQKQRVYFNVVAVYVHIHILISTNDDLSAHGGRTVRRNPKIV